MSHAILPVQGSYNLYRNEILIEENVLLPELDGETILAYFKNYLKSKYTFESRDFTRGVRDNETGIEIINHDNEIIVIIHY